MALLLLVLPFALKQTGSVIFLTIALFISFIIQSEVVRYTLSYGESVVMGLLRRRRVFAWWLLLSALTLGSLPIFMGLSLHIVFEFLPGLHSFVFSLIGFMSVGVLLSGRVFASWVSKKASRFIIGLLTIIICYLLISFSKGEVAWNSLERYSSTPNYGWWSMNYSEFLIKPLAAAVILLSFGGYYSFISSYSIQGKKIGMAKYTAGLSQLLVESKLQQRYGSYFQDSKKNRQRWSELWHLVKVEQLVFFILCCVWLVLCAFLIKLAFPHLFSENQLNMIMGFKHIVALSLSSVFGLFFVLLISLLFFFAYLNLIKLNARVISESIFLLTKKNMLGDSFISSYFIAVWVQIILGFIFYNTSSLDQMLMVKVVISIIAGIISIILIFFLNKKILRPIHQPGLIQLISLLLCTLGFVYYFIQIMFELLLG